MSQPHGAFNVICVVPVSSRVTSESVDVTLVDWQQAQLVKPSVARVHRLTTILQSDLVTELGQLGEKDSGKLKEALSQFLYLK